MVTDRLQGLLLECEEKMGSAEVERVLKLLLSDGRDDEELILTIVANAGVHHMPPDIKRGEVFILSEGSLDFSTKDTIVREFSDCLVQLAAELKRKAWKKIYLVPFGPTTLSALAKLVVFRVTGMETIDVMHVGGGAYVDVEIDARSLILSGAS